jgi:hypothetical protein
MKPTRSVTGSTSAPAGRTVRVALDSTGTLAYRNGSSEKYFPRASAATGVPEGCRGGPYPVSGAVERE